MRLCLVAGKPTDAVLDGFLPAAQRLGLDVMLVTDQPDAWPVATEHCDVWDFRAVIRAAAGTDAVLTNSDHLQVQVALAAAYLGLCGKDWRAALRAKDKLLMRQHLAATGVEKVTSVEITAGFAVPELAFPVVVKPVDGVASEDVVLVRDAAELDRVRHQIGTRRGPAARLIAEQYLPGQLHTVETISDGRTRWVLGGFRTTLSDPPAFIEDRLDWDPPAPGPVLAHVERALDALGAGFGACHTEYVRTPAGPRLIELNDRLIGDRCEFLLGDLLGLDLFELTLRLHLGEPLPDHRPPTPMSSAAASYIRTTRSGLLVRAPSPGPMPVGELGVSVRYEPFRAAGSAVTVSGSNRDYLGVLLATGPSAAAVDRSLAAARAAGGWVVE